MPKLLHYYYVSVNQRVIKMMYLFGGESADGSVVRIFKTKTRAEMELS
jgi:hypothetical protein